MLLKQHRGHPLIISSLRLHLHRDKWYSFPSENAFESSFLEAHRVRIVDCIGTETTTSAYATSTLHAHQGPGHDTDCCSTLRHAI
ncbi:hypothetical protein CK203_106027 [Vitis vinifera]|uniref:Uncharacterized protein n=1 Tax=Vitis vinifera TaxID=29760 RepID=A0A438FG80_VITVI|nr:hypothetical protein CK203_106027 [Vitis vinifera]